MCRIKTPDLRRSAFAVEFDGLNFQTATVFRWIDSEMHDPARYGEFGYDFLPRG